MLVPNRHGSSNSYRYGFNGKEKDDELKGIGNSYDFGARMLDPRVGRWFATDRLEILFPGHSTYNYSLSNPIYFIDPDGNGPLDWYKDKFGNFVFDKNIKSQKDLGNKGTYLGETAIVETFAKGKWVNTYGLNADGSVVDSFGKQYMDNFGSVKITKTGVKIINEYTISEKWEDKVVAKLRKSEEYIRSIEGSKYYKSSNTGIQVGIENDFAGSSYEFGLFSTQENSVGLYRTQESFTSLKISTVNGSFIDYIPLPYIKIKANINNFNPFKNETQVNNTLNNNMSIKSPNAPMTIVNNIDINLNTKTIEHSTGVEIGTGLKTDLETKVMRKSSETNTTDEICID